MRRAVLLAVATAAAALSPAALAQAGPFSLGPDPVTADGTFTRTSGGCGLAATFGDRFAFTAMGDGTLTIVQPSTGDEVAGQIAPDGTFRLESAREVYEGRVVGDRVMAMYIYITAAGCRATYQAAFVLRPTARRLLLAELAAVNRDLSGLIQALVSGKLSPKSGARDAAQFYNRIQRAAFAHLPTVFGVPFRGLYSSLTHADLKLEFAAANRGGLWRAHFDSAGGALGGVAEQLRAQGSSAPAGVADAFAALGRRAKALGRAEKQMTESVRRREAQRLENEKRALIAKFPTVLGVPFLTVYTRLGTIYRASLIARTNGISGGLRLKMLRAMRSHKDALERALANPRR